MASSGKWPFSADPGAGAGSSAGPAGPTAAPATAPDVPPGSAPGAPRPSSSTTGPPNLSLGRHQGSPRHSRGAAPDARLGCAGLAAAEDSAVIPPSGAICICLCSSRHILFIYLFWDWGHGSQRIPPPFSPPVRDHPSRRPGGAGGHPCLIYTYLFKEPDRDTGVLGVPKRRELGSQILGSLRSLATVSPWPPLLWAWTGAYFIY